MKLSTSFLKDYISYNEDYQTLAEDMTRIGNEYESCHQLIQGTKLITGEVVECVNHPNSDHLHVCKVNIGTEVLQIVCGASNVRCHLKVIVALIGCELPNNIVIKKSAIRGVESNGMLCSLEELGIEKKYLKKEEYEGIMELPEDTEIGIDPRIPLQMDDEVIDFELTSNRGDLLSILGMSYEIGALYDKKVNDIDLSYNEIDENINNQLKLNVNSNKCSLFLLKKVKNITIKESPTFIKNRLIASGIRPINNVVDISNYVMLETGQPLHFYDADKLGNEIIVRDAIEDESLVTLDNVKRILNNNDLVIANKNEAIGLAGVMGGLSTEVDDNTKNIVIESAIFNGISVRLTSKKILRSEASNRFEKGLDPNRTYMAIKRSCHLLKKYANCDILSGMLEYNKENLDNKIIPITYNKIISILGIDITLEEILDVFRKLGFSYKIENDIINVIVPKRRLDVNIKEDLIEEVGRIYGVDKIKGKLPIMRTKLGTYDKFKRQIRNKLVDLGLNETLSYTLINEKDGYKFTDNNFKPIKVSNPMTEEHEVLRYGMISSLYNIYEYNKARNNKDICIFELSRCFGIVDNEYKEENKLGILLTGKYKLGLNAENVDFYYTKGILEELLDYIGLNKRYNLIKENFPKELHPFSSASIVIDNINIGFIGKIHPNISLNDVYVIELNIDLLKKMNIKRQEYKEISKYPNISKDISFIFDNNISNDEIIKEIKKVGGKYLVSVELFDLYEFDNNTRALAYNLIFNDKDNTLTDEIVMPIFNNIISDIENKYHAVLRNK